MSFILQGWLLGIAYVAPIGMQNMYLINTSLERKRSRALQVAMIIIFFDITLAFACFFGIGVLLENIAILRFFIMCIGSLAVIYIGYGLIKAKVEIKDQGNYHQPIFKVIATCFAVTWLNPQAIIDGSLLLGGFRASLNDVQSSLFILGVMLSSTMWFLAISMLVSTFKKTINTKVLKAINVLCGIVLIFFGMKLGYTFLTTI